MDTQFPAPPPPVPVPLPYPPHHHHHHHLFLWPHHHLRHHHHVIICPNHHNHPSLPHHHCPRFKTYCEGHMPPPLKNQLSLETNTCQQRFSSSSLTLQEPEHVELEEEEDEPVFVLTDEWRDFFAKI